jgi:hypothetical protein
MIFLASACAGAAAFSTHPSQEPSMRLALLTSGLARTVQMLGLTVLATPAFATTTTPGSGNAAPTWASTTAAPGQAGAMVDNVSDSVNSVGTLIMGPGMYVVMALGVLLALWGFAQGSKEKLFTGIGLFLLAAVLRTIFAFVA